MGFNQGVSTVEPRYLELAYFELPLISVKIWSQFYHETMKTEQNNVEKRRNCS